jgi:hypothetical protein
LIYTAFLLIALLEIAVDIKIQRSVSWKRPILVAKIVLAINLILNMASFAIIIAEISLREIVPNLPFALVGGLAICATGLVFGLVTVGWISMIMKSKSLGYSNVHLRRFRKFVFGFLCVGVPLVTVCSILSSLEIAQTILLSLTVFVVLIFILVILFGTSYHLIKTLVWAFKSANKIATMKKVGCKTIFLALSNVGLIAYLVHSVVVIAVPPISAWTNFASTVMGGLWGILIAGSFLMFLQSYLFRFGFLKGYSKGFRGEIALSASSSTLRTTASASSANPKSNRTSLSPRSSARTHSVKSQSTETVDSVEAETVA